MSKPFCGSRDAWPSSKLGLRSRDAVQALLVAITIEGNGAPSPLSSPTNSPWSSAPAMTADLPRRTNSDWMTWIASWASAAPRLSCFFIDHSILCPASPARWRLEEPLGAPRAGDPDALTDEAVHDTEWRPNWLAPPGPGGPGRY